MIKLNLINSTAVPIPIENIDTDQIIPARFLKTISKNGFGENLFRDWRFDKNGNIKNDFVLNNPNFKGEILVTKKNFGCGSSREHAAWAILDYGFKVVISSFFADIFVNNALNNGLLPVKISETFLKQIFFFLEKNNKTIININLELQTISINNIKEFFEINQYKKKCLINGYDDLDFLMTIKNEIISFQEKKNKLC